MAKRAAATAVSDDYSEKWDGEERRVSGVGDRRNPARASMPFQEYPKMVRRESDGATFTVNSKEHEDAVMAGDDMERTDTQLDVPRKPFTLSAEDADGTAGRMAQPGDRVPGDQSAAHPATVGQAYTKKADEAGDEAPARRAPRSARKK